LAKFGKKSFAPQKFACSYTYAHHPSTMSAVEQTCWDTIGAGKFYVDCSSVA